MKLEIFACAWLVIVNAIWLARMDEKPKDKWAVLFDLFLMTVFLFLLVHTIPWSAV